MGMLDQYDEIDRVRIRNLAAKLVEGQIERGAIPMTDEAIRAAMPDAVRDAKQIINAVNEYLCG